MPMGRKLQETFIHFLLFASFFLVWGGFSVASAQISLDDNSPLEVNFSMSETQRQEASLTVSLSDIETIISPEFTLQSKEWIPFQNLESTTSNDNYYVSERGSTLAAGRIQIKEFPNQTYFLSSIQNNSGQSIGNLIVAFDFIYNFYERPSNPALALQFRVNDGEWKNAPTGMIERGTMRSVEDEWSSFSLHINLDDIYLRESDTIHLMWIIDESEAITTQIPLALQRMGIYSEQTEQSPLNRGDLIITEILPSTRINGSNFEYIEVYNPSERPISLKGVELISPLGTVVIQQDIFVEPYDYTVISNADISGFETVNNSYFYSGNFIEGKGSRIELERNGKLIASATYEIAEPGVSLELNRVSNAYDGYSSLQDFVSSQNSYFQDLQGSPGVRGSTSSMFTKELINEGYYILSIPGKLVQRLNRNSSLEFYSLEGELLELNSVEPNQPILIHKLNDQPVTIYAEEEVRQQTDLHLSTLLNSNSRFVSLSIQKEISASKQNERIRNATQFIPITQVWNQQREKFRLQVGGIQRDHWSPFVVNSSVAELIKNSENQNSSPLLDRFLQFALVADEENGNTEAYSDVVMLGFIDSPSQQPQLRYDLPKLELSLPTPNDGKKQSLLYLTSNLSKENYNSFTHFPYEIDKAFEAGLGLHMDGDAGNATLKWKLEDKVPDEWVITIEDTYNGTIINLKEEKEYQFRYNSATALENNREQNNPKLSTITPTDRPRFVVKIRPFETFVKQDEELETPQEIELRPNYPNPFNPSTNINFYLPEERAVRVGIYNIVGQQVALLLDDTVQQGEHSIQWDASDKPSGIYIVQLESGNRIFTRKITLIK